MEIVNLYLKRFVEWYAAVYFQSILHISYIQYIKTMIRMAKKQILSAYLGHSALYTKIIYKRNVKMETVFLGWWQK